MLPLRLFALLWLCLLSGSWHTLCGQIAIGLSKDSLQRALVTMPADTNKVALYFTIGQQYDYNKPDSAVYFYRQAKALSEKLNYPKGIVRYLINHAPILFMQGKPDQGLQLAQQALRLSQANRFERFIAISYGTIAMAYQYKKDFPQAISYYLKALPLAEQLQEEQMVGNAYINLSELYNTLEQYEKAKQYALRTLAIGKKTNDNYILGPAYVNLSDALTGLRQWDKVLFYAEKGYRSGLTMGDLQLQISSLNNMGTVYMQNGQPDRYAMVLQKMIPLADSLGDVHIQANTWFGLAEAYFQQRQFPQAEQYNTVALELSRQHALKEMLVKLYLQRSDLLIAQGRLPDARKYRQRHDSLRTLFLNEQLFKDVQELETKYQVQQHRNETLQRTLQLEKKTAEARLQRNWLLASLIGMVLLVWLLLFGYRFYRQRQRLSAQMLQSLQTTQENMRLKALLEGQTQERQRISQEMHDDMGSGLTSLLYLTHALSHSNGTTESTSKDVIQKLTRTASGLIEKMNEIIWMMNDSHDTLPDLLTYLRMNLAESLENAGLDYQFHQPESIPALPLTQHFRRNVYLIAKEAVHNSIKHANASCVKVWVDVQADLLIRISDDGKGIAATNERLFGNGLRNMQQRALEIGGEVQLFSGHSSTGHGTTFQLCVSMTGKRAEASTQPDYPLNVGFAKDFQG